MTTIEAYLNSLTRAQIRLVAEKLIEQMEDNDTIRYDEEDNYYYWEVNGNPIHDED